MVMQNRVAILGAVMLALAAAPAFGQNVKTQNNGEAEVRFGDGCVVYYAKNGHRTDSRSGCTSRQNHRADEVVAEYRRQHGFGGDGGYDDVSRVVVNHQGGAGQVEFEIGCVVRYDRDGRMTKALSRCTNNEIRRADRAIVDERRDGKLSRNGEAGPVDCPNGSAVGLGDHAWNCCGY